MEQCRSLQTSTTAVQLSQGQTPSKYRRTPISPDPQHRQSKVQAQLSSVFGSTASESFFHAATRPFAERGSIRSALNMANRSPAPRISETPLTFLKRVTIHEQRCKAQKASAELGNCHCHGTVVNHKRGRRRADLTTITCMQSHRNIAVPDHEQHPSLACG